MKRRFQFSVASLLLGTAVIAIAADWWALRRRVIVAREHLEEQRAGYDVGTANVSTLRQASKELLQAELAMPFMPSDRVAWLSYLDRTREIFRKQHWFAESAMFVSKRSWHNAHRFADELLQECHDVEDRLGLPHVDTDFFRLAESELGDELSEDDEVPPEADSTDAPDDIAPPPPSADE